MTREEDRNNDSGSESEADTDTDDEYDTGITAHNSSRLRNLDEIYMKQRGLCRITQIPFSEGIYGPAVVPRCVRKPLSEENAMLVLKVVHDMHSSNPDMPWRTFSQLLHLLGERAEI